MKRKGISKQRKLIIYERYGYICCRCGKKCSQDELTIDHYIPVSRGGTNALANTVTMCLKCNNQKRNDIYCDVVGNLQYMSCEQQLDTLNYVQAHISNEYLTITDNLRDLLDKQIIDIMLSQLRTEV